MYKAGLCPRHGGPTEFDRQDPRAKPPTEDEPKLVGWMRVTPEEEQKNGPPGGFVPEGPQVNFPGRLDSGDVEDCRPTVAGGKEMGGREEAFDVGEQVMAGADHDVARAGPCIAQFDQNTGQADKEMDQTDQANQSNQSNQDYEESEEFQASDRLSNAPSSLPAGWQTYIHHLGEGPTFNSPEYAFEYPQPAPLSEADLEAVASGRGSYPPIDPELGHAPRLIGDDPSSFDLQAQHWIYEIYGHVYNLIHAPEENLYDSLMTDIANFREIHSQFAGTLDLAMAYLRKKGFWV
jgi:hypothetical protein